MTRRIFCKILLVVVAILGLFVLSGVLSAQGNRDTAFERVKAVQEEHTNRLMAIKGVEGTAIGLERNDRPALKVFTAGPGVAGIPKTLEGVAVQVVVTGKFYALIDATARFSRPVPIGVSTGHPDITAGTIGCRVTDGANVYALSNNHIYANSNEATIGDAVIQPGTSDFGESPADDFGTLADFEPIVFKRKARNEIDAAIALTTTDLLGTATPAGAWGIGTPSSTTVEATLGLPVKKYGRTTRLTYGRVSAINATVNVGYGPGKTAEFVKQIIIEPTCVTPPYFSKGGDSGSLIVTQGGNNPVGLLFAGSDTHTLANPIDLVLARFGVTVDDTPNNSPSAWISNPRDGDTFDSDELISFSGNAWDADAFDAGNVTKITDVTESLVWASDKDGQIGTGGSFSIVLSEGAHTITATATDLDGQVGIATISITVEAPAENEPPIVSITSPADGSTFDSGATIDFAGTASDTEDGDLTASLVWTSSKDGPIGSTGGIFSAVLSDGTHTITASVTDSGGKTASASVSITVGTPPSGDINVESIVFSSKVAGPNKFLYTTVKVVDGEGLPLDGVRVEMTLTHQSAGSWNFAGNTGSEGTIKFTLGKAPSGDYEALVTNLTGEILAECTLNNDGTIIQ